MSSAQFWWNWWVTMAVAVGTLCAVIVALFGQAFRSKFFPPRLTLGLNTPDGEATMRRYSDGTSEQVRYYHLRVTNSRRWSPATGVQVALLQLEEPGPDGQLRVTWTGDVPFGWRHQQLFPVLRTIGAQADIDLCSVSESRRFTLHLLLTPLNLASTRTHASPMVLSVQARGHQADSAVLRLSIRWDGQWEQGTAEMRGHLVVQKAT
jgi:hypothetical protein